MPRGYSSAKRRTSALRCKVFLERAVGLLESALDEHRIVSPVTAEEQATKAGFDPKVAYPLTVLLGMAKDAAGSALIFASVQKEAFDAAAVKAKAKATTKK
jgi:hypothetical protein